MSRERMNISFSGGQSSAYMTQRLIAEYGDRYQMVVTFANTGEEDPRTLDFVDRCDRDLGFQVIWLEAVTHNDERIACTHRVVTYQTAARNGEPFRHMIAKYGIPNASYPHCTRELKMNPIKSYLRSIGWEAGSYVTAIGIRADEPDRVREDAAQAGIVYPMVDWFPTIKSEINDYWNSQSFRLGLLAHEGNCKTCWKKSTPKLVRIAQERPGAFRFNLEMERAHGLTGAGTDRARRVFFRGHQSAETILSLARQVTGRFAFEDADADAGCSESCEPW